MSLATATAVVVFVCFLLVSVTTQFDSRSETMDSRVEGSEKVEIGSGSVVIRGNETVLSENRTFQLGFFSLNDEGRWYLGIWYVSIPTPTYVWVANRETPVKNLSSAAAVITAAGKLAVEVPGGGVLWQTENEIAAVEAKLLEEGNLVLLAGGGEVVWQSFDFPTDTFLPGMNLSGHQSLTCWRSPNDPAPGLYSMRLKPPLYGEIELVHNGSQSYWTTGNWTGVTFSGVPEMTIKYIYEFHFVNPFTPEASFGYTTTSLDGTLRPPLTRFQVASTGQIRQFTWTAQTEYWTPFWSQPENLCRIYGLCGSLGFCDSKMLNPCKCLDNFVKSDNFGWESGDFSGGCRRGNAEECRHDDGFEAVGPMSFEGALSESSTETRSKCERKCVTNCLCIGLSHDPKTNLCKILSGSILNLRNSSFDTAIDETLYLRVPKGGLSKNYRKNLKKTLVLVGTICGFLLTAMTVTVTALLILKEMKIRKVKEEETVNFPVTNLKVFTFKELRSATRGFSEKLGHGGFGTVFLGKLDGSTAVAVKRLERPGGAEKEFRAEVCTIGSIQHVNLVRLRGFCSENSHRLLVYDYMPNGALSAYLRRNGPNLSWAERFRAAIGAAKGIAYLHEECRDCIIHCDIKPENILLDEDLSAKVSDFGLAKLVGRDFSRILATTRGTLGYVAPEWISGVAITAKADVYSYGMTLLELLGGRRNVEGPPSTGGSFGGGEKWFFPPWAANRIIEGNVEAVMDERVAGDYNVVEARRLGLVAVWCIQDEEDSRPTMGMVVKMLEGVVEVGVPPPPKLLQALVSGESFHGVGANSASGGSSLDDGRVSGDCVDSPKHPSDGA